MTISEKRAQWEHDLAELKSAQDRLAWIVERGRRSPPLPAEVKTEAARVEGCLAKVWLVCDFRDGRCYFQTDSDSAIVKGIAVLLCQLYSGQLPREIVETPPAFLEKYGISQHLTPNRRNSLSQIWRRIESWARAQM